MRTISSRCLAIILSVLLIYAMVPASAFADVGDGDYVLTSIKHSSAQTVVSVSGTTSATLTVPYSYSDTTVDLESGLDVAYSSTYDSATPIFSSGSVATIDGSAVTMTVKYRYAADTATEYSTDYTILVKRAAYNAPTFSGIITKSLSGTGTINFGSAEFSAKFAQHDGDPLGYISLDGVDSSVGTLKLGGSKYTLNDPISIADLDAGKLTFAATSTGTVSYIGYAYSSTSSAAIVGSSITVKITVSSPTPSVITYSTKEEVAAGFSGSNFNTVCRAVTGEDLSYVTFAPPLASYGTLYTGYTSATNYTGVVSASARYYYSSTTPVISSISLVPYKDYYGSFSIGYTAYSTGGASYNGTITVNVSDVAETTPVASNINYSISKNETLNFVRTDFNSVCNSAVGEGLSYVKFTLPSTTYGKLYYNYTSSSSYDSRVTASTSYYYNSSNYLSKVSFVPAADYTGTCNIAYSGVSTAGDVFTGTVKITIGSTSSSGYVTYSTAKNTKITFDEDDFNDISNDNTNADLNYVKFTLPSSSYGVLYYNYTSSSSYTSEVTASTKYYYDSSLYLSRVTFVPKTDYTGTVTISYTGYSEDGDSYAGKVKITVGSAVSSDYISYSTAKNTKITFDDDDFNDFCNDETNADLNYVKFTLPSSSYGVLYYNYTSSTSYTSAVTASSKYCYDSSLYLSRVTFVPATDYTGTVSISYTGYSDNGDSYTGKVKITVGSATSTASSYITYSTKENTKVTFSIADFNKICRDVTNRDLAYVKFTLPSSSYGTLYYGYSSPGSFVSLVSSSTYYYYDYSLYLSKVTFVPAEDYVGPVTVAYTGYSTDGDSYTGKIQITVTADATTPTTPVTTAPSAYFPDVNSNYSWAAVSIDALYKAGYITGTSSKRFNPGAKITRGDFILMLYKALGLRSTDATTNFSDVPKGSYYYSAISVAKALGVAQGTNGKFNPKATLTREDAIVLVNRALTASGTVLSAGSSSDLSAFKDSGKISSYAYNAVATLVKAGIISGTASKINPTSTVTRAEMAVIVYRAVK